MEQRGCRLQGVFALSNVQKGSQIRSNGLPVSLCSAQSQMRIDCNNRFQNTIELQSKCDFTDNSVGKCTTSSLNEI
jgi:hypothetical protein